MAIQYRSGVAYRSSIHYDGSGNVSIATLGCKARIKGAPQTLTIKARIRGLKTLLIRANITRKYSYTLNLKARISQRQGWPIPNPSDGNYALWQPTQLDCRARLTNYLAISGQMLRVKGRIGYRTVLQSLQCGAHIGRAGTMQMRASIRPQFITSSVRASFSVQRTSQTSVRAVYYMQGTSQAWALGAKARIVKPYTSRCTGHFIVATPIAFSPVVVVENPVVLGRTLQTFSMRTRVVK